MRLWYNYASDEFPPPQTAISDEDVAAPPPAPRPSAWVSAGVLLAASFAAVDERLPTQPQAGAAPPGHSGSLLLTRNLRRLAPLPEGEEQFAISFEAVEYEDAGPVAVFQGGWRPFSFADEDPTASLLVEQEEFWVGQAQAVPWRAVPFADDETLPQQPQAGAAGPAGHSALTLTRTLQRPGPATDDEAASLAQYGVDEELPPPPWRYAAPWTPLTFVGDDELWVSSSSGAAPPGHSAALTVRRALRRPGPYTDDPVVVTISFGLDEPNAPAPTLTSTGSSAVLFRGDEESGGLAFFYPEQEEPWVGRTTLAAWTPRPFSDDEALGFPGSSTAPPSGSHRLTLTRTLARPGPALDDDRWVVAVPFGVDSEDGPRCVATGPGSSAVIFLDSDESAPLVEEEYWVTLAQPPIWVSRPATDDEIVASGAGNFNRTDEEPTPQRSWPAPWVAVPFRDEHASTSLASFHLLADEPAPPQRHDEPWLAAPFSDDEVSAGLTSFGLDQEEPWLARATLVAWTPIPFADDEASVEPATIGVQDETPWVASYQANPWTPRPFADDETGAGLTAFALDQEEPWTGRVTTIVWTPKPFTEDDPSAGLAYFYQEQEEPWAAQATATPWAALTFADDEALGQLRIDQEEFWRAQQQAVPWLAVPFADDEASAGLAAFALDPDEPWVAQVAAAPWAARPAADDEASASLAYFWPEQEEPWVARVTAAPWLALPQADDDQFVGPAALEEEWDWRPARQTVPWAAVTALDDETGASLAFFGLEEDAGTTPAWGVTAWAQAARPPWERYDSPWEGAGEGPGFIFGVRLVWKPRDSGRVWRPAGNGRVWKPKGP